MKYSIFILIFIIALIPSTQCGTPTPVIRHCPSPFSCFGSWPYYSYDYFELPCCAKAYDDYYS